jgi:glutaredoxin 2
MNEQIQERITELVNERNTLEAAHNAMVQQNQKINQEFQQQVVQNQTRFAQISGALRELQQLVQPSTQKDNNHDNLSPTPSLHNRTADVRPVKQSQDR